MGLLRFRQMGRKIEGEWKIINAYIVFYLF